MRAAAQLAGVVAHLDHPYLVAVLLPEQRQCAHRACFVQRRVEGVHLQIADQYLVDFVLGRRQHRLRHGSERGEVEPEPARRVLRPGLRGRLAESAPERPVHEVRRRVRAGDRPAALDVDIRAHRRADHHLPGGHGAAVHDQAGQRRLHVRHRHGRGIACPATRRRDDTVIGELAPALGVERRPVQDHLDGRPGARRRHRGPAHDQAEDGGVAGYLVVAGEGDPARLLKDTGEHGNVGVAGLLDRRVSLGALSLFGHEPAKLRLVHHKTLLGGHLESQVDREAVGVMQLECLRAADGPATAPPGLLDGCVEDRAASAQRR